MPDVVMLSEVNPLGGGWGKLKQNSYTSIKAQAKNWYGYELENEEFFDSLSELEQICETEGKKLIIRDWSFVNFSPHEYNNYSPPNEFLTYSGLKRLGIKFRAFALIRDPIDIWISRGLPLVNQFFDEYFNYLLMLKGLQVSVFKFEEFTAQPDETLRSLCEYLDIDYNENVVRDYYKFHKVNGDSQRELPSRGASQKYIRQLPRKVIAFEKIQECNKNQSMVEANRLMGYPARYHSRRIDFVKGYLNWGKELIYKGLRKSKNRLGKFIKKLSQRIFRPSAQFTEANQEAQILDPIDLIRKQEHAKWRKINGDRTLRLNYPLNENSLVFDLGGYKGQWSQKIFCKYNCDVFVFEVVEEFAANIQEIFSNNKKVRVFSFGLGDKNEDIQIYVDENKTSVYKENSNPVVGKIVCFRDFIAEHQIEKIDLMKINIEGGEFELLEHIIDTGLVEIISNIQVQFHNFISEAEVRRLEIQRRLERTHTLSYCYDWIWENWVRN
jgi:FkbM family methyltransferase